MTGSPEFWNIDQGGKRGRHGPTKEWLRQHVREGWDLDLRLGTAGDWSYEVTRLDLVPEGMRVVLTERFAGSLEDYLPLHEDRFHAHSYPDRSAPPPALFRFGVEYSDGLRITTADQRVWVGAVEPAHPEIVISDLWSSGHITEHPHPYWIAPPPPKGTLRFAVEWPLAGVPFLTAAINLADVDSQPKTPVTWPPERIRFELRSPTEGLGGALLGDD